MSNGSGDGHNDHAHRRRKPGLRRRLLRWWYGSGIYQGYCRAADRLHDWWYPRSEGGYGYAGYGRSGRSRLRRTWDHLRRWISKTAPFRAWRFLSQRFFDWWYPEIKRDPAKPGYGYGHRRRSRLSHLFRSIGRWFRRSAFSRWMGVASNAFYNWWYPLVDDSHGYSGYYGRRRRSRPALAVNRVRRWWRASWLGRGWQRVVVAFWEWWYPEVTDVQLGYGYGHYGSRRYSRLQLAARRVRHWWRHSWLGKTWRRFSIAFWEWWYPEPDAVSGGYGYGSRQRVSRPVRFAKRALKWFRRTWLGRKCKWLLDDLERAAVIASWRIRQYLTLWRIRQWLLRWQTWAVLVGLIALGVLVHEYGLPRYRAYQERQFAQQAELWLKKGDLQRAIFRARQTLTLNPSNAIATRVFGSVADSWNSPQALYWRQRAAWLLPDVTNRLALASTSLRFEGFPFPSARKALSDLPPETTGTAAFHLIAGAMAVKLNNLPEADRHFSEALRREPENPAAKLSLAVVRLHANEEKIIADARTVLELLRTDRSVGLVALRSLVADSLNRREFARAEEFSQQVLVNTQSAFSDRIVHLAILHAAKSDKLEEFLKETQVKAGRNVKALGEVAAWMNGAGRSREVLDWLTALPAEVARQGFLPILIADAHASLGAWDDLEAYLLSGGWPGMDHIRFAMLAMTGWKKTGEIPSTTWRLAVREASRSAQGLSTVAELASAWGWQRESEDATWEAVERFPKEPWPLDRLDRLYTSRRDTEGLRRVYAVRLQRNPEDRLARNNYAMVSLLLNREVAWAAETAADLHASDPKSAVFASTQAFSLHRQGRTKDGIGVLRSLPLEQLDNPAVALYYGVLLVADGQKELAQGYLKRAEKAFLLPEEKALLDQALAQ